MTNTEIKGYICSPQQSLLWSSMRRHSGFNGLTQGLVLINGSSQDSVEKSLHDVVRQHEALRTHLALLAGMNAPLQVISDGGCAWSAPVELNGATQDPDGLLENLCREELAKPFDFERGPLLRARLVRLADNRAKLILTASALILDAESMQQVVRELAESLSGKAARPRTDDVYQYADYASWRTDLLNSDDHIAERSFWTGAMSGGQDRASVGDAPVQLNSTRVSLSPASAAKLQKLAEKENTSLADVLLAMWMSYCGRIDNTTSARVAALFSGRTHPELKSAVGFFAQFLPLTLTWSDGDKLGDLVGALKEVLSSAEAHQDYAALDGAASSAGDVRAFTFADLSASAGNGAATLESLWWQGAYHAVTLDAMRSPSGECRLSLRFDAARIPDDDISRIAEGLAVYADEIANRPEVAVDKARILTDAEHTRLLRAFNETAIVYPGNDSFHRLFEAQVARTPGKVAVSHGTTRLTYAELDARANQLASVLLSHRDIAAGKRHVAILLQRTPNLLVAMLGVMKAGLTYVPLDPENPEQRLHALLAELPSPPVISEAGLANMVPPTLASILMEDISATGDARAPAAAATGDTVAYVLFTSGSTGKPKGVMVTHAALCNYVQWAAATYELDKGRGALVHTSVAFDLTITSLLAPLVVGQQAILLPEVSGVAALATAIQIDSDYSLVKITPSHLKVLRGLLGPGALSQSIRSLVIGGEALDVSMVDDARAHAPSMRIFNEYGPTEATVGCSMWELKPGDVEGAVPIGHPIANTALYVLDRHREPVPVNTPGELYVAGAGVAAGYLGDASQENFSDDPWGRGRMYKTGDLVRRRADGSLTFLGRVDDELKINGVRIQPAEIDAVLSSHPSVSEAFVVADSRTTGDRRLIAYVVARQGHVMQGEKLRDYLSQRLPAAMVPSFFVAVASIPINRNGKRDASALPPPDDHALLLAPYTAPRTHEEHVLQDIFSRIFERERVGIDDNYFVLGGDSLRSVQVSALAQKVGLTISVAQIHRSPTIRELAAKIRSGDPLVEAIPKTAPFSLISAEDRARMSDDIEDAYPLNLLQEGMIYHREFAAKSAVYHAMCTYRIRAPFNLETMREVIRQIIVRHPLLRTSFDLSTYSQPLQLIHKTFNLPFKFDDLRGQSTAEHDVAVDGWMEHEKQTGFDLDGYPLIRYQVHQLHDDVFQLGYSFHHEIIDGWSDAFMVTELLTHYLSEVSGKPHVPPRPTVSFREAIALEQAALKTDRFKDVWLKYLDGAQLMNLPRLKGRLKADKGARTIIKFEIPISKSLSDSVKTLAEQIGVPLKTLLLAAHLRVMSVFGGGKDVLSYTVGNGRPENSEGHGVIGLFVNSLAFRIPMPGGTWKELVLSVLRREQELLPYRRYPMAELKRQAGNEPLSETLFFYNHYHVADVLQQWENAALLGLKVYGESTFPYCINAYLAPVTKLLGMRVEYDDLQYTPELMDAIGQCYLHVLNNMIANPLGRYDLDHFISADDVRKLTRDWNDTQQRMPQTGGIHRLIESVAGEFPDRIAVSQGTHNLSYGALNRQANQLARRLRASGVKPGDMVPLCLDRSPLMPVAILAVLKAGAAYVPLDPGNPKERIDLTLRETAAPAAITISTFAELASFAGQQLILLDREQSELDKLPGQNLPGPDIADLPAYAIYTSGSTGRPKGVVISHRSLINSTLARQSVYKEKVENFLLLSSYAFDSSVAGIFWTLVDGGRLVLQPESTGVDLTAVEDTVRDDQITHTLSIPSLYEALLQQHRDLGPLALRTVIMAGEACPVDLYECHSRTLPGVAFFNEYGPTEATVWATVSEGAVTPLCSSVLIGKPIPNVQSLVLDPFGSPAPVGVSGELHIGGAGLAHGFLNAPALTAERFVPNAFAHQPGARMYRTGDLVRWLPNGKMDFLGRMDGQVKINGFRVETGEIESVLGTHPKVQRAVVQVRADDAGTRRLVAYILADAQDDQELAIELGKLARDKLPKYMLPSQYVRLTTLPTTASGKLDRKSLPEPPKDYIDKTVLKLPRTATEEVLAGIWGQVLGTPVVGIDQQFYQLGGESLRAMRIMARVRSAFKVQLPINLLMAENLTVERVAEVIEAAVWQQSRPAEADRVVGSI